LHGQALHELLELIPPGNEVGLTVHLNKHTNPRACVDVAADHPLSSYARGFLSSTADAFRPQPLLSLRQIALAFLKGLLAIHHPGTRLFTKLLHNLCTDFNL